MLLDEYQGLPLIEWFNLKVLEEEYRQIELYVRNHIKKETKVGTTIFLRVLLFVGAIFRVLDVFVDIKNHVVENNKFLISRWRMLTKIGHTTDTQILVNWKNF